VVRSSAARDLRVKGFIVVRRWVSTCAWKVSFLRLGGGGGFVTVGVGVVVVADVVVVDSSGFFLVVIVVFDFSSTGIGALEVVVDDNGCCCLVALRLGITTSSLSSSTRLISLEAIPLLLVVDEGGNG